MVKVENTIINDFREFINLIMSSEEIQELESQPDYQVLLQSYLRIGPLILQDFVQLVALNSTFTIKQLLKFFSDYLDSIKY